MTFSDLPAVNATLNGLSAILLGFGYYFIRHKNQVAHKRCMIAAFVTSTLFLICYLTYHAKAGRTVFKDPAWFRPWYLTAVYSYRPRGGDCAAGAHHAEPGFEAA